MGAMTWEVFKPRMHRNPRDTYPFVTIDAGEKNPRINFSLPCAKWLKSKNATRLEYLWDSERRRIAFRPTTEGGYALSIRKSQASVSGKSFLRHIGNPPPGRYPAILGDEMIEVDITSPRNCP